MSKFDAIHIFKDWNMSGDTAFSGKTEQPPSVHGLLAQIKNMLPTKSDKDRDSIKKKMIINKREEVFYVVPLVKIR
ncbi:hypothetical protein [Pectobacterium brasiliense]|uniref:hypothetical protein n=1 Tax=Pectobacterium brasiliense TaxID=180957 RepID=UPI00196994EF|nr:hypothetical protein [Pectobacterium brasiliense]MBN3262526.1 hypothetical protein [Pectobacterium brasiliense]